MADVCSCSNSRSDSDNVDCLVMTLCCFVQEAGGAESPGMSFDFRIKLWALCMGNLLAILLFQKVITVLI